MLYSVGFGRADHQTWLGNPLFYEWSHPPVDYHKYEEWPIHKWLTPKTWWISIAICQIISQRVSQVHPHSIPITPHCIPLNPHDIPLNPMKKSSFHSTTIMKTPVFLERKPRNPVISPIKITKSLQIPWPKPPFLPWKPTISQSPAGHPWSNQRPWAPGPGATCRSFSVASTAVLKEMTYQRFLGHSKNYLCVYK